MRAFLEQRLKLLEGLDLLNTIFERAKRRVVDVDSTELIRRERDAR